MHNIKVKFLITVTPPYHTPSCVKIEHNIESYPVTSEKIHRKRLEHNGCFVSNRGGCIQFSGNNLDQIGSFIEMNKYASSDHVKQSIRNWKLENILT